MHLKRLILQGFKSFADRTEIQFANDITMIVGPNGCGKSNISDAVRWVLGEQSVRTLRGQKTEDLIFSGSMTRKAKNSAEVTMVLDNSDRELPVDTAEVSVTRRILRNGDSDFFINQRSCRLKDIQDLFAATGLGKGSLAIIGQNRVDQVLSAHPEERRLVFEEVAGISRFRMRREEGLGKLRHTEENMDRVKDLMVVLDERLGPMKEAADKARQWGEWIQEKQAAEASLSLLMLDSVRRNTVRYETERQNLEAEKGQWEVTFSGAEAERVAFEENAAAHEEAYRKVCAEVDRYRRNMDRADGDYRVQEAFCLKNKEELERIRQKMKVHSENLEKTKGILQEAIEETRAAQEAWKDASEALRRLEKEKSDAAQAYETELTSSQQLRDVIREKTDKKERLADAIRHGNEEKARLTALVEHAEANVLKESADKRQAKAALDAMDKRTAERAAKMKALEDKGKEVKEALKQGQERSFSLLNQWNEMSTAETNLVSKRAYLVKAEKEYANFSDASRSVLQADMPWQSGVLGAFGELLRIPHEYAAAAEAILGGTIANIVTDTAKTAGDIILWMKQKNAGRTTFYPLDAMHPMFSDAREREAAKEEGICGIAADLFGCVPEIDSLKRSVLGRVLIAENIDVARRIAQKYKYRLSIVTLDGQLFRPGGAVTGGSLKKKTNSFFGRKLEIEVLNEKITKVRGERLRLEEMRKVQERDNAALSETFSAVKEEWQTLHVEEAAASGRREGLLHTLVTAEEGERTAKHEADQWRENLKVNERRMEDWQKEIDQIGEIPILTDTERCSRLKQAAAQAAAAAADGRVYLAQAEAWLQRAKESEMHRQEALTSASDELAVMAEELTCRQKEDEEARRAMAAMAAQYEKDKIQWQKALTERDFMQEEADQMALRRSENDKRRKEAQDAVISLDKKMTELSFRLEEEKRQEEEELHRLQMTGFTEKEAEERRISGNKSDLRKRLAEIQAQMDALGPVNPNAEKEYALEQDRIHFYEMQMEDLERARQGIAKVIENINTAMADHFMDAFEKINEEFSQIMQLMFRGGSGRLLLTDPEHPLESGVELYLELPGKKRQPLSLMSGGERALTVSALLISFLAYRPAPFCFLDEIDAALDDANVERFGRMMTEYKKKAQFIVITHRKKTMEYADTLQGVTMGEKGVSSLVTVHMGDYIEEG